MSANISEPWSQWTGPGIICAQVVICSGSSTGHTVLRGNFPSRASYTCQCAVGKCPRCYCEDNSFQHGLSMRACHEEISSSVDTCVLWGNVLATQRCSCGDNSSQHGLIMLWRNILISTVMEQCPHCCCGDNSSQHGLSMSWGNVLISCAMEKFPRNPVLLLRGYFLTTWSEHVMRKFPCQPVTSVLWGNIFATRCCCCGDISSQHQLSMSWGNFSIRSQPVLWGNFSQPTASAGARKFLHYTMWPCCEETSSRRCSFWYDAAPSLLHRNLGFDTKYLDSEGNASTGICWAVFIHITTYYLESNNNKNV